MIKFAHLAAAAAILAAGPGHAVSYTTTVYGQAFGNPVYLNRSSDLSYAGYSGDTVASAQALTVNSGTATANFSGSGDAYLNSAVIASSVFDFGLRASGRVRVALSGFANSVGSGAAGIGYLFLQTNRAGDYVSGGEKFIYSCRACIYSDAAPGTRKLSKSLNFSLTSGDSVQITVAALATNSVPGTYGYAQAYIDPVMTMNAVPEPASWAMLIAGFGLTAAAMRRRRQLSVVTA